MSEAEEPLQDEKHSPEPVYHVVLNHKLKLELRQTQMTRVQVNDELSQVLQIGRVIPSKELESQKCDILKHLWEGDKEVEISVTNWGMEPMSIPKGTVIGVLKAVELVAAVDPAWQEPEDPVVVTVKDNSEQDQRKHALKEEVSIEKECSPEDRTASLDMILANHCTFALSDRELGETDLVEHNIKLTDSALITTHPRRLPYALHAELEEELERLLKSGCI